MPRHEVSAARSASAAAPCASPRSEASRSRARRRADADGALLALVDLFRQLRDDVEEVAYDTEVDEFEDRRFRVLVDGDDRLRRLHARAVLDGAGDPDRHVELRRDRLAGLADLVGVRVTASVGGCTRGTDRRAETVGELLDEREVGAFAEPSPTRDDDGRFGELRAATFLLGDPVEDLRRLGRVADRRRHLLLGGLRRGRLRSRGVRAHGDDGSALADLCRDVDGATEDALLRHETVVNADRVGDDARLRLHCQAARDLLALRSARDEYG